MYRLRKSRLSAILIGHRERATIPIVKHTLLVPIRFLLVAMVVLLLVTLVAAAVDQGRGTGGQEAGIDNSFLQSLLFVLPVTFPVSLLASVLLLLFQILKRPGIVFLSLLLLFLVTGAAQYAGSLLLSGAGAEAAPRNLGVYRANRILESPTYSFAFRERQGNRIEAVLLVRPEERPRMSVHREGYLDVRGERLILPAAALELPLMQDFSPYAAMFAPPPEGGGFVRDVALFARELRSRAQTNRLHYLALLLSTTLLFVSYWSLARATSWKLFNVILVVISGRLFFLLFRLLNSDLVRELSREYIPPPFGDYLASASFALLALLLIAVSLLMPPLKEWKRGVGDA